MLPLAPLAPLAPPTPPPKPTLQESQLETVYFDFDKSTVKKSEQGKLAAVADYLKGHAQAKLQVEGHCDELGTEVRARTQ